MQVVKLFVLVQATTEMHLHRFRACFQQVINAGVVAAYHLAPI